ncbi:DUF342 domain-containing protein [Indiicoccus explosivorum]|uniref:DUF342 domain-containing protein n=1 Tax=Indiicoccus explosivorum TaxID=1917864 RepID=UPI000B43EDE3|nr:FapA family protein [Indiicoccus explosivorum]
MPAVRIGEGVRLYRNGQPVQEPVAILSEKDAWEAVAVDEEIPTDWAVEMDREKVTVTLTVQPGCVIRRSLLDTGPGFHVDLAAAEKREPLNDLPLELVAHKLDALGVTRGKDEQALKSAQATEVPGTFIVAAGKAAEPGKDGWFEPFISLEVADVLKEDEQGRIDYRESRSFPNVEKGDVIGTIHPPVPGKTGYTVTDEPLPPKPVKPASVRAVAGAEVADGKVVATESGRPRVEKRGRNLFVSVVPKLVHNGDVGLESGNIRFKGDVEVLGDIGEGMLVEADGDVIVHKVTNGATVTTSGMVLSHGNIIGSEISAGENNMLVTELGQLLGTLHLQTEQVISIAEQLIHSPAFNPADVESAGLQPVIRVIVDKKFKGLPGLVKKYREITERGEKFLLDDRWKAVSGQLAEAYLSLTTEKLRMEKLVLLSKTMKELHELSETAAEPDAAIVVPMVLNSSLYCSGDIMVSGTGCVNSKVHAGGKASISGIARGGTIFGRLGAAVGETGAESGTKTTIAVPAEQEIRIGIGREGTVLQFGKHEYVLKETRENIVARLDESGRVVL